MPARPATIDDYLGKVPADQRAALQKIRKAIRAAAPDAEECINYGVPAFRLGDKSVAGFGASAKHCSYYPMSGRIVAELAHELTNYRTSKGSIQFPSEKPLSAALVRKLVKARIAELTGTARSARVSRPRRAVDRRSPGTAIRAGDRRSKSGQGQETRALQTVDRAQQTVARARRVPGEPQTDPEVTAFMARLDHPLKADIGSVRRIILGVSPEIREGIKWNGPSFRTKDYFATVFLRDRDRVALIFHKGAKVKDNSTAAASIPDPLGMIEWLATDRCRVTVGVGKEIKARRKALEGIVREWLRRL